MKHREQALLLLKKASQDEALLDEVLDSETVSDEVIGFHCQQAAEKMLKAVLSDLGVRFRKTHEIGALLELLAKSGIIGSAGIRYARFFDAFRSGLSLRRL